MSTPTPVRYIPLDAAETTVLKDNLTLLPQEVYRQLAEFIDEALDKVPNKAVPPDINEVRSHNAVSVDGDRGTGKTSVLVNLETWLAHEPEYKDKLQRIHILKPIDPTLLEENESLFLHIIVAAVLSDKKVKEAQKASPESMKALNKSLESLAFALESVKKQNADYGMDRLRSLFGNQRLAECVQDFFRETLRILDKDLLVLPIDDVDTSLHRAFENLEIVRRYLVTPYVLPIVSGDRALYNEVTWRDFHQRLTKDSGYKPELAFDKAVDLAQEYQRKLLPLPRRLEMPPVSKYLHDNNTQLKKDAENVILLSSFYSWLEIFISGPVNGLEGSQLELPVPSIRALTQLINKCGKLIPELPPAVRHATSKLQVQRAWQLPGVSPHILEAFEREYNQQSARNDRDYDKAYAVFAAEYNKQPQLEESERDQGKIAGWQQTLWEYFRYEVKAGAVCLVLRACQHWHLRTGNEGEIRGSSVFDTPLFQPLCHDSPLFSLFEKSADFSEWSERLKNRLPRGWLFSLQSRRAILPYPVAEVGVNSSSGWKYWEDIPEKIQGQEVGEKAILLVSLSLQYNFYTTAKQSLMLNIGRIFEVIIASLVSEVSVGDLRRIMQQAPFYSARALAPTKALTLVQENSPFRDSEEEELEPLTAQLDSTLVMLQQEIAAWRSEHGLKDHSFSPWLIYKVFNKVFSQFSNSELLPNGFKDFSRVIETIARVFYSTWSAFGSFEKGVIFGLPEVVATVNLNSARNFERSNDHFNVNLGPFALRRHQSAPDKALYGKCTRTVSYYLADHPLRNWIEEVLEEVPSSTARKSLFDTEKKSSVPGVSSRIRWLRTEAEIEADSARNWFIQYFKLADRAVMTKGNIIKILEKNEVDLRELKDIKDNLIAHFPDDKLTQLVNDIYLSRIKD